MREVSRKFDGQHRARRRVPAQRPVPGRHAPARLLPVQADLRRRAAGRLVGEHRAPDRRRRQDRGRQRLGRDRDLPGGAAHPADQAVRGAASRSTRMFELLAKNVRVPHLVLGDVRAQVAACLAGERGYLALIERYGVDELAAAQHGAARPGRAPRPQRDHGHARRRVHVHRLHRRGRPRPGPDPDRGHDHGRRRPDAGRLRGHRRARSGARSTRRSRSPSRRSTPASAT